MMCIYACWYNQNEMERDGHVLDTWDFHQIGFDWIV